MTKLRGIAGEFLLLKYSKMLFVPKMLDYSKSKLVGFSGLGFFFYCKTDSAGRKMRDFSHQLHLNCFVGQMLQAVLLHSSWLWP